MLDKEASRRSWNRMSILVSTRKDFRRRGRRGKPAGSDHGLVSSGHGYDPGEHIHVTGAGMMKANGYFRNSFLGGSPFEATMSLYRNRK